MTRIPIEDPNSPQPQDGEQGDTDAANTAGDSNEVLKLRSERDQLYERLARATAEFKNSQKRLETEFDQRIQYANSSLIKTLLPTIDNFERALAQDATKVDATAIHKGLQIVYDQLIAVLKQQKIEEIAAVMQQPSDQYTEPTVTMLLEKGYAMHGRTLRPAKVAVSKIG
jgi:molecular chaperone GrpE